MLNLPKLCFIMALITRDSVIKFVYSVKQSAISLHFFSNPLRLS